MSTMSNEFRSASIAFNCGHCNTRLSVPASQARTEIVCLGCQAAVIVPAARPRVPAAAADDQAGAEVKAAAPRPRTRYCATTESKPKSNRTTVMIVAGVVVAAALIATGVSISNGMERRKIEGDITQLLVQADAKFKRNEVDAAADDAKAAQAAIAASTQPLDEELKKNWDVQIKRIEAMNEQFAQLNAIMAGASRNLSTARDRLHDKQQALGKVFFGVIRTRSTALAGSSYASWPTK